MASKELFCWNCGASLSDIPLPLPRLSKCKSCKSDVHVCRMCEFYDTTVNNSCREPIAEKVGDKKHANFCGYLQPAVNAYTGQDETRASAARSELNDLFDMESNSPDPPSSSADAVKQKLEQLFGRDDKE